MFKINYLRNIFILFLTVSISLPLLHIYFIYPEFVQELVKNKEDEAMRTAEHLTYTLLDGTFIASKQVGESRQRVRLKNSITPQLVAEIDQLRSDFGISKINVFDAQGVVIYSTNKAEIGNQNKHDYFKEKVSRGIVVTELVEQQETTLENELVYADLIETYIPVMEGEKFLGAYEIYYDISDAKTRIEGVVFGSNIIQLFFSVSTIIISFFVINHAKNIITDRLRLTDELHEKSITDELTGLNNRRNLLEQAAALHASAIRYEQPFSVLMLDVDHFKQVNDRYGHLAGDEVLRQVAALFKQNSRKGDILGRYGGEEFLFILPNTGLDSAFSAAEKIRKEVENLEINWEISKLNITISIGASDLPKNSKITLDQLINKADMALYQSKSNGRNRTTLLSAEETVE